MNKAKRLGLGVAVIGVLLGMLYGPIAARTVGWLYGEALRVASPIRDQTPDVTLAAGGIYAEGTLEVDGATRLDGALTLNAALDGNSSVSAASSTHAGARSLTLKGAYTTAELDLLSAAVGDIVYNFTIGDLCRSSATTVALPGAWVRVSSRNPDMTAITCHSTTP